MGTAWDTVVGTATAPGATLTAVTVAAGDTLTIRNTNIGVGIWLLNAWAFNNVAGVLRIRSPRLHDNVQGIRLQVVAAAALPLLSMWPLQRLYPQDTLIEEISGSGVAGNIESAILSIYYADLPGIMARFIAPADLMARGVNVLTNEVDLTPGVGGGYTGASALNKTFDLLIANTDYALLGYTLSAGTGAVTIKGADTGNLRIPMPGISTLPQVTGEWFLRKSLRTGLPLIPVINSANKANTTIEGVASQAGTAFNVSLNLVQLAPLGGAATIAQTKPD